MSTAQYAYLHARVSLLAGRLIGQEQIEALIDQPATPVPVPQDGRPADAMGAAAALQATAEQHRQSALEAALALLTSPDKDPP